MHNRYRHRLILQRDVTRQVEDGDYTLASTQADWQDYMEVYASIQKTSGNRTLENQGIHFTSSYEIRMRYVMAVADITGQNTPVDELLRIYYPYKNIYLTIHDIEDVGERQREMIVTAYNRQ